MTHNQVWTTIIALGWIALAVSAYISTDGFTRSPQWIPVWAHGAALAR